VESWGARGVTPLQNQATSEVIPGSKADKVLTADFFPLKPLTDFQMPEDERLIAMSKASKA